MTQLTLFSDMVVFSSYATQIVMAFMMLTMIFIILPRATVSANRINEVLENISFTADKGETVAFIGSTGSGKSTLINLIPRSTTPPRAKSSSMEST